jgi:hypothetical protein
VISRPSYGAWATEESVGGQVSPYRRLEIPTVDVANSDFPIGRSSDSEGEVSVDSHRTSGNREVRNTRP